jgi:hypothetical protein
LVQDLDNETGTNVDADGIIIEAASAQSAVTPFVPLRTFRTTAKIAF